MAIDETDLFGLRTPDQHEDATVPAHFRMLAEDVEEHLRYGGAQAGKSIIDTEQTRGAAFGYLGTPDRVQGLELAADGLIHILFLARWRHPSSGIPIARLILDGEPLVVPGGDSSEASISTDKANWKPLFTVPGAGLRSQEDAGTLADFPSAHILGGRRVTGSTTGGVVTVLASAGIHEVGVHFATSANTVSVRDRKLWAWVQDFPG